MRGVDHFVSFTKEGGQGVYYDCPLIMDGLEVQRPGKYITEDLTDLALDFIGKKRDNPFCLYLSHKAVHFGFRPPPHLANLYEDVDLGLPPESDNWITYTNNNMFVGAPLPMNMLYRNYCRVVASVDEQVGRVMEKLTEMGILDDTVIIYAGDNGHFWGEHGMYDKRWAYEESIRIPLFHPLSRPDQGARPARPDGPEYRRSPGASWSWPACLKGLACQGRSLVPVLTSARAPGRTSWLYEHFPVFPIPIPGITGVRTDRYKYLEYQNQVHPKEMFDLKKRPQGNEKYHQNAGRTKSPARAHPGTGKAEKGNRLSILHPRVIH